MFIFQQRNGHIQLVGSQALRNVFTDEGIKQAIENAMVTEVESPITFEESDSRDGDSSMDGVTEPKPARWDLPGTTLFLNKMRTRKRANLHKKRKKDNASD